MVIVLFFAVGLVGAAAALLARAIALPRVHEKARVAQLSVYGFGQDVVPEAQTPGLRGGLDRIARVLGHFAARHMQGLREAELRKELMAAGLYRTSPVTLVGYRVLCALTFPAALLWALSGVGGGALGIVLVPVAAIFGWVGPMALVRRRARDRLAGIDRDLPELIDLLVVTVESGMGFSGSLALAAESLHGSLGDELRLALQEQSMGLPADEALANMLQRADTPAMRSFVRSVRQGESLGVSIGQIMRGLAVEMRQRRRADAEERAQKAPIKILFPLIALIFPALFMVILVPAILNFQANGGLG